MFGVRIHGRGGQGVVTAAELLSVAGFEDGRHALALPSFGSERTGAPVVASCRVDDAPIRTREPLADPDAVLVQDPTLLGVVDVFSGLKPGGWALVNTARAAHELLDDPPEAFVLCIPASDIARARLGRQLPGAPLLGALAALGGPVTLEAVEAAFRHRFPGVVGEGNAAAARDAFAHARRELGEVARA
jgi:pyruvate ferredoxin oxidoreductase gamma subunit